MSVAVGPIVVTAGDVDQSIDVPLPGGQAFDAVVLYNLSPTFLLLNASTEWLAPWTANIYPLAVVGYPVRYSVDGAAGNAGQLLATFYGPEEIPANSIYPLALPATSVQPTVTAAPQSLILADVLYSGAGEIQSAPVTIGDDTILLGASGTLSYAPAGADPLVAFFQYRLVGSPSGTAPTFMYQALQAWDAGTVATNAPQTVSVPVDYPTQSPLNVRALLGAGGESDTSVQIKVRAFNAAPFTLVGFAAVALNLIVSG